MALSFQNFVPRRRGQELSARVADPVLPEVQRPAVATRSDDETSAAGAAAGAVEALGSWASHLRSS